MEAKTINELYETFYKEQDKERKRMMTNMLKTIQSLDKLEIAKACVALQFCAYGMADAKELNEDRD